MTIAGVARRLEVAHRSGASEDRPEGARYITISDTLALQMAAVLREAEAMLTNSGVWPCAVCGRVGTTHDSMPHGFEFEDDEDRCEG